MPTTAQILEDLRTVANDWWVLAVLWHGYFGVIVCALLLGARPVRRTVGVALALPFLSVSVIAWLTGNPFNGTTFALLTVGLFGIAVRLNPDPVRIGSRWSVAAGSIMVIFGWYYPHFLDAPSGVSFLYAAPTGLIPCPTLSIVIGVALVVSGLQSRPWCLVVGIMGMSYGLFGAIRLGVNIDWTLVAGSLFILVTAGRKSLESVTEERRIADPAAGAAPAINFPQASR